MKIVTPVLGLFLIIIILNMSLFAQGEKNFIGGSFGGSDFHLQDKRASPLIFSGIDIAPAFQYFYNGETNKHYFEASYFYNYLSTSVSNFHTENHKARLRYGYFHNVYNLNLLNKNIGIFAGASLSTFLCHSDYYYNWISSTQATANETWYWSNSFDLSLQLIHNPSPREFFSVQIFIPVINNVSRPKYSPSADYNYEINDWRFKMFGETEYFFENFSLNTIVTYQHPLYWKINFQLSYDFYFCSYADPKEMSMYMNNFRGGLFFSF